MHTSVHARSCIPSRFAVVDTVDPCLNNSSFRTHKFRVCESHYVVMNIINVVCYLNHLHVQLSELFTYPNKFTRPVATGVRISEDIL